MAAAVSDSPECLVRIHKIAPGMEVPWPISFLEPLTHSRLGPLAKQRSGDGTAEVIFKTIGQSTIGSRSIWAFGMSTRLRTWKFPIAWATLLQRPAIRFTDNWFCPATRESRAR